MKLIRRCKVCGKKFTIFPSQLKYGTGEFCSTTCMYFSRKTGTTQICPVCNASFYVPKKRIKEAKCCSDVCRKTLIEKQALTRFWDKVKKTSSCWIRTGALAGKGYSVLNWNKKPTYAHRVSWIIHFGPILKGKLICHKCDIPNCVRPDHLFIGTQSDNLGDMIRKGRGGYNGHPGEKHPSSKLTSETVLKLRKIYKKGRATQQKLAERFNVTQQTISKAISGYTWKHI